MSDEEMKPNPAAATLRKIEQVAAWQPPRSWPVRMWHRVLCFLEIHDRLMKSAPTHYGLSFWFVCRRCKRYLG